MILCRRSRNGKQHKAAAGVLTVLAWIKAKQECVFIVKSLVIIFAVLRAADGKTEPPDLNIGDKNMQQVL